MPKILRILNRFNLGGPSYNAAYLTHGLAPEYETKLIGGIHEADETSSDHIFENLNVSIQKLPSIQRSVNPKKDAQAVKEIRQIIREFKPDIVHTHAAKAGALGRIAASKEGVKHIVHTYHGHVFKGYFGKLKTQAFLNIERYLGRKSDALIAISSLQKEELVNTFKIAKEEKFHIVPLGFDLSRFRSNKQLRNSFREKHNLNNEIAIGIIGRFAPIKNHELLIDSYHLLRQKVKNTRLFFIGDGETKELITRRLSEYGIPHSEKDVNSEVCLLGWEPNVENVLNGLDIVALSSNNEGTPVSIIEAMANGKATISTDVGGVRDVIIPETGLVVPPKNIAKFSEGLIQLCSDEHLRNSLSANSVDHSFSKFNMERLCNDMKKLYRNL